MPIVAILEWPADAGIDFKAEYARVAEELNGRPFTNASDWGGGMLAHAAAVGEDGRGVVVDVWEDQAAMDAWMARVMPLIEHLAEPKVQALETYNVVTAAPVRA
jgi:hypothetical protein